MFYEILIKILASAVTALLLVMIIYIITETIKIIINK